MELIPLVFLLVTFLTTTITAATTTANTTDPSVGFRVDLTHVDASRNYSRSELLRRSGERSKARAKTLAAGVGPVLVHPSQGEYIFDLAIGTPPLYFTGILDTGSDLVWTQCKPCMRCIPQPSPLFNPFGSASFSPLPCSHKLCRFLALSSDSACGPGSCLYHYHYGDNTDSIGFMGTETFTFGSGKTKVRIPHIGFGCGLYNGGDIQNSSGVIGFGLGSISLISQLGVDKFSYCFTDDFARSPMFFGSLAILTGPNIRTTPIIRTIFASYYYLSLKGITVGKKRLPIPSDTFRVKKDGSGGIIIDSGTSNLMLDTAAYRPMIDEFKSQVKLKAVNATGVAPYELCYSLQGPPPQGIIPRLVFNFEGADWEQPEENYVTFDPSVNLLCLMVMETSGLSIFGNLQTQNMHVLYDLKKSKLSFKPTKCDKI